MSLRRALAAAAAAAALAPAAAGCSNGSAQAESCTAAIAFMGALTGTDADFVVPIRDGAQLAVDEYNAEHADCPVGFIEFDSQGDPAQARSIATDIVEDDNVVAVVGPAFSGEAEEAMPVFDEAGLPVITPSATNPDLGTRGWSRFHRVVATDAVQGPAIAIYLSEQLAARRVAVVDDSSSYGVRLADLVALTLDQYGVEVAVREQIDPASLDYSDTVEAIADAGGVDTVYFGGIGDPGGQLARQLRDAGVTARFVGSDGVLDERFIITGGAAVQGAIVSCPCARNAGTTGEHVLFTERFTEVFGEPPGSYSAEAFDAATVLLDAIQRGATSRTAVDAALRSADVAGVTKQLRFDDGGEVAATRVFFYEVQGDRFVPVARVDEGQVVE